MRLLPTNEAEKPPGIITTLSSGFDLTARHLWLVIVPLALDIFYWLGPRLSVKALVEQSAAFFAAEPSLSTMAENIVEAGTDFNLFTTLSVPIIGVPALLSGGIPDNVPLTPTTIPVDDPFSWFLLFTLFSLLGLLLTTLYLVFISKALGRNLNDSDQEITWRRIPVGYFRLIGLGFIFILTLILISVVLLPIAFMLSFLASSLSLFVLLFGFIIAITYFSLSIPGIIFRKRPLVAAVLESAMIVHGNLSSTLSLLLLVIIIGSGTNLFWQLADEGSWIMLVSLVGHAFISTGLVAAIFIFYRDRSTASFINSLNRDKLWPKP